jgi:hypothetical protein
VAAGEPLLTDRERLAQQGFRRGRIVLKLPGHGHFDQRRGDIGILISAQFAPHLQRLASITFGAGKIAAIQLQQSQVAQNLGYGPVLWTIDLLHDFAGLHEILFGLRVVAFGLKDARPIRERSSEERMLFPECLAANLERLMQYQFRLLPIAPGKQNPSQVIQWVAKVRMTIADDMTKNRECLALGCFCLCQISRVN